MNRQFARIVYHGKRVNRWLVAAAVLLLANMFCSLTQAAPPLTPQQQADQEAVLNYSLSVGVVNRIGEVIDAGDVARLPCMDKGDSNGKRSLQAMADALKTEDPGALPILTRYGFTPKAFITAFAALTNAGFTATMLEHPDSPFAKAVRKDHQYNQKNVAFYQAHHAQITTVLNKVNDDPACGD